MLILMGLPIAQVLLGEQVEGHGCTLDGGGSPGRRYTQQRPGGIPRRAEQGGGFVQIEDGSEYLRPVGAGPQGNCAARNGHGACAISGG